MTAESWLLIIAGMLAGGWLSHMQTWAHARKIEHLVEGGLQKWDDYDKADAQAKGQSKVVDGRFT